jgi:hypothetical protein
MTNTELLDLLREARDELNNWHGADDLLLAHIDAALAERQDSAKDVVEPVEMRWGWHEVNSPNRLAALLMDGTRVECRKAENNGVMGWAWNAMIQPVGFAPTLDEAKAAAIAAARGMK